MVRRLPLSPHALARLVFSAVCGVTYAVYAVVAAPAASTQSSALAPAACPPFPGAGAFVSRIDNRYMPLIPGTVYTYSGQEDGEKQRTVVEVTNDTKTILGIPAVVVLDTVSDSKGGLIEQTFDWFGQDNAGNVWYLGEDTKEFENGQVVSTAGSWKAVSMGLNPGSSCRQSRRSVTPTSRSARPLMRWMRLR